MLWTFVRPFLFALDPERAHHLTLRLLKSMPGLAHRRVPDHPCEALGLHFRNPIGLAAGMDKNAECLLAWQNLGFGFAEVGTVTARAQSGNPPPRLFRLPKERALFNRMGFNNNGAVAVARAIEKQRNQARITIPIGINIGKSAVVALADAAADYVASFTALADLADYITINVSSPNTKGLRDLQAADGLTRILEAIGDCNQKRRTPQKLLVKIAPDLDDEATLKTANAALSTGASGLIISNTTTTSTLSLPGGGGGLSGAPLFEKSTRQLSLLRQALGASPLLIGSGGVMDPKDAAAKMSAGAHLVQVYTGFVYGGPAFVRHCIEATISSKA